MYKLFIIFAVVISVIVAPHALAQSGSGNLSDRLQQVVEQRNIQLDPGKRALVLAKCQAVQQSMRIQSVQTASALRKRQQVINDTQLEMVALKLRMTRQGVDASELELLRGKLQQKADKLTIASDIYGQAVSDAQTVNCIERPEQFMAALELTREARAEQQKAARQVTVVLYDSPHSLLPALKKRLVL